MNQNIYPSQAANLLNISLGTLNNWRRQGYINAIQVGPGKGKGARYVYSTAEIERILTGPGIASYTKQRKISQQET